MKIRFFFLSLAALSGVNCSNAMARESIITFLSWYPSYGTLVGCEQWREGGFGYAKLASQGANRPLTTASLTTKEASSPVTFGLSANGGERIRSELKEIKAAGFDVVAYDMLPSPSPKRPSLAYPAYCGLDLFERYGQIGNQLGLKLAIFSDIKNVSADYPKGYVFSAPEWRSAYMAISNLYGNKPWYWRPRDVPAIFQFGATSGAIKGTEGTDAIHEWEKIADELSKNGNSVDIFLDVRPNDYSALGLAKHPKKPVPFLFAPGAPSTFSNKFLKDLADRSPYAIWSVSPGYYNRRLRAYLPPDFSRIHDAYTSALANNAQAMLVATWNDFEERTDIVPSTQKGNALVKVFGYYNAWFKNGTPPILNKSTLVLAVPTSRFRSTNSAPPSWGGGKEETKNLPHGEVVYYWAYMKNDGWFEINKKKILLNAGLHIGRENIGNKSNIKIDSSFGVSSESEINSENSEGVKDSDPGMTFSYKVLEDK